MTIKKLLDDVQMDFYRRLKERKINRVYQEIGQYIYELYKSGDIVEDENLLKLLKKIDELNKDEK